ncbi:unnamed protein product [Spirodela intermedia]|uniref:Sulfurtransferase n=1 Tax=Spirodela intermedia TaxID=51605 RepID=A0A7I8JFR9_SPIIN|nr:unnamed protein product [Spirodela intermedia]CAA6668575.1 unnamed protein product [Spirodela intermedia]
MAPPIVRKLAHDEPVVSVHWLSANIGEPDLKVLDASWYMPHEERNPLQEFRVRLLSGFYIIFLIFATSCWCLTFLGAFFFDIDAISDKNTNLPHMLPSEEAFAAAVSALGIAIMTGWLMFRAFGHSNVWVLDGGLPLWRASGYDVESSTSDDAILKSTAASDAVEKVYQGLSVGPTTFEAKLQPHLVWTLEQIQKNIQEQEYQQVDARSKGRFDGVAPEPRKGIKSGHIPGSKCIPFGEVLDTSQTLLPQRDLAKRIEDEGISLNRPIVASCGTGVTACILALGLYRLGMADVPVYDGSWTEWALTHARSTDLPGVISDSRLG